MDKAIVTVILIVAGVVCCMAVFGAVYPAITHTSSSILAMTSRINDRIESQIDIIAIADQSDNVSVWVKNVGAASIRDIENCDVFFGKEGNFSRIAFGNNGSPTPYWDYAVENGTEWKPTATLRITIHAQNPLSSGMYIVKVVTPTGICDDRTFST